MKRFWKSVLKSDGPRRFLCWLAAAFIRVVWMTGRWTVVRAHIPAAFWAEKKPMIAVFWHGRLMMMSLGWPVPHPMPFHMLISRHRDGVLIARVIAHFDLLTIGGSSSRGGTAALRDMVKTLKGGACIGVTPDGPRGPRMRAVDGVVRLAQMTGIPVVPATFGARWRKVLGTWDRFVIAWPFTKGCLVWGEPIHVPRDADAAAIEAARRQVEDGLNAITAEADRWCGVEPVPPAEVSA